MQVGRCWQWQTELLLPLHVLFSGQLCNSSHRNKDCTSLTFEFSGRLVWVKGRWASVTVCLFLSLALRGLLCFQGATLLLPWKQLLLDDCSPFRSGRRLSTQGAEPVQDAEPAPQPGGPCRQIQARWAAPAPWDVREVNGHWYVTPRLQSRLLYNKTLSIINWCPGRSLLGES